MKAPLSFWLTLLILGAMAAAGAFIYAQQQHIPRPLLLAALPAVLLELALYLAMAFPSLWRFRPAPARLATGLAAASLAPWAVYCLGLGVLPPNSGILLLLVAAVAFWYVFLPPVFVADLGLLTLLATVVVFKTELFRSTGIYPDLTPRVRMDFLAQFMWIRLGVGVMLLLRRAEGVGFGFLPTREEWAVGARYYLRSMPFVIVTGYALGIMRLTTDPPPWWQIPFLAAGLFFGYLWTVALSEEFFLRGLLLNWLRGVMGSPVSAALLTAFVSGVVHLKFRGFPNWKFAVLSAVVHWFFGQAFVEGRGIRAGMVAHALTVTTWIIVFAKSA